MTSLNDFINTCNTLLNSGVIDTKQFAKALQTYTNKGIIDFGLTDEVIENMSDNFASQLEGLSFANEGAQIEGGKNEIHNEPDQTQQ